MIPNPKGVNSTHMLNYVDPRRLYVNIKGLLFLSNKGSFKASVWSGGQVCVPQGHIFKYKGPAFSEQPK